MKKKAVAITVSVLPRKERLTEKDKKEYLNNPWHCPFCNSEDISAGDGGEGYREVTCNECGKMWNEIFEITDIEEIV